MKHAIEPDSPPTFSMILKQPEQDKIAEIQSYLRLEGLSVSDGLIFRTLLLTAQLDESLTGRIRAQKLRERKERNELRTATFALKKTTRAKGPSTK